MFKLSLQVAIVLCICQLQSEAFIQSKILSQQRVVEKKNSDNRLFMSAFTDSLKKFTISCALISTLYTTYPALADQQSLVEQLKVVQVL